jgi:hypothetical protein
VAIFHLYEVTHSCGHRFKLRLARSVNAARSPHLRSAIIDGSFHRFTCEHCGLAGTAETAFHYIDPKRDTLFRVQPRQERHLWKEASEALEQTSARLPDAAVTRKGRHMRVVFGLAELREKLLLQDSGIDDRTGELLKVLVVHDHPFLTHRPGLRLSISSIEQDKITFAAAFDHEDTKFHLTLPREHVPDLIADPAVSAAWAKDAHGRASIFELERDHWVNMWRWSPQTEALALLVAFAKQARSRKPVKTGSAEFKRMLRHLPRGKNLPTTAKPDLQDLFNYAKRKRHRKLQDDLFEIRFGIQLDDDWSFNRNTKDVATIWKLLKALPPSNVEGNIKLHEIGLRPGSTGGQYYPKRHDIQIDSAILKRQEVFEDTVRHEVGHAVEEMLGDEIGNWLRDRFGWESFENSAAGVDAWVDRMGGWGKLGPAQRDEVRHYLLKVLGPGKKWEPHEAHPMPPDHPWFQDGFGPRLACEQSVEDWYENYQHWYRANGKAFCMNFQYKTFMAVDVETLSIIHAMPDKYAAMSGSEFFAEMYALYYDLDDPKRPNIPADVVAWLAAKIGAAGARAAELLPARRSAPTDVPPAAVKARRVRKRARSKR